MDNIINRISTRNYLDVELNEAEQSKINQLISANQSIFGNSFQTVLVDQKFMKKNKVKRVGTYGVITGNPSFVFAGVKNDPLAYMDYGYALERIVLELEGIDLQTCWLGGTFSRKTLFRLYKLSKDVTIPAVVAVGKKSNKKSFVQNLMGKSYHNRKPFETLFYNGEANVPLKVEEAGVFAEPLEGMRMAPSAMNGQPWRAIVDGCQVHFYCETTAMIQMKYVDMGIGLYHFDYVCQKNGVAGDWRVLERVGLKNLKYLVSFVGK